MIAVIMIPVKIPLTTMHEEAREAKEAEARAEAEEEVGEEIFTRLQSVDH